MKCPISTRPKKAEQQKPESMVCHPKKSPLMHYSVLLQSSKAGVNASREVQSSNRFPGAKQPRELASIPWGSCIDPTAVIHTTDLSPGFHVWYMLKCLLDGRLPVQWLKKKWFKTIASKLVLGNKRQNTHSSNYCSLNQLATLLLCVAGDGSLSKGWYVPVSLQMLPCNMSSPQASLEPLWPHILQVKTWLFADLFKKSSILLLTCTL